MSITLDFGNTSNNEADIRLAAWSGGENLSPAKYMLLIEALIGNGTLPPADRIPSANVLHPFAEGLQFRLHVPFVGDIPTDDEWKKSALEFGVTDPRSEPGERGRLLRQVPKIFEKAALLEPEDLTYLQKQVEKYFPDPDRPVEGRILGGK